MNRFAKSIFKEAALQWLAEVGYTAPHEPDIDPV